MRIETSYDWLLAYANFLVWYRVNWVVVFYLLFIPLLCCSIIIVQLGLYGKSVHLGCKFCCGSVNFCQFHKLLWFG